MNKNPRKAYRTDRDNLNRKLSGCSVCWTCCLFRAELSQCWINYRSLDFSVKGVYRYIQDSKVWKKPVIEDPGWHRCAYWRNNYE